MCDGEGGKWWRAAHVSAKMRAVAWAAMGGRGGRAPHLPHRPIRPLHHHNQHLHYSNANLQLGYGGVGRRAWRRNSLRLARRRPPLSLHLSYMMVT